MAVVARRDGRDKRGVGKSAFVCSSASEPVCISEPPKRFRGSARKQRAAPAGSGCALSSPLRGSGNARHRNPGCHVALQLTVGYADRPCIAQSEAAPKCRQALTQRGGSHDHTNHHQHTNRGLRPHPEAHPNAGLVPAVYVSTAGKQGGLTCNFYSA